jgi:hypothetical protein
MMNLIPLFLGSRTNVFVEILLGLSPHWRGLMYRWLGRIFLVEAVAHSLLHPYMIMWEEKKANGGPQILEILVHCRRNFSRTLSFRRREKPFDVTIRGPYGSAPNFDIYDKVCFIASGVGIAAHLLAIRHLITEHHARKVRARRIALI